MQGINWWTFLLLFISNTFMSYAWYGHLKDLGNAPLWKAILISWSIALLEYTFLIPANRMGAKTMSLEQLKITQEVITLTVFIPFSYFVMKTSVSWNYLAAMICLLGAVWFIFRA